MAGLGRLCSYHQVVRRMSDIVVRESQPTKFTVVKGKFIRTPVETPTATEEVTHTGQFYEDNDWRKARFYQRTKLVNRNWAVKMINEIPPIEVEGRKAVCDGRDGPDGSPALGHPRVYINLDKGEPESCMYCGLRYVQKQHH
ncbi:NADH dehydrogenase [ubiquinone] iron-sulfur protein 6, mitochondrial-like [Clavelina lepadiformis]|uniref:NADH dehydrogenase [ubiquinone] iron-sulfur protein 6, mitochondrial-like n=1 Tax=Clavelina lepadiformis TaxID=159417 RepID=UPI004041CA75